MGVQSGEELGQGDVVAPVHHGQVFLAAGVHGRVDAPLAAAQAFSVVARDHLAIEALLGVVPGVQKSFSNLGKILTIGLSYSL